ncbi:class I SAM-dependent methyltransferase [Cohnella thermotolerans]|uniref:class I SAM-dependent methyltransferase n=1 Tax=Cohnella thermotolerans TaxID=329858 RepID=UPI00041A4235|nr:class I SAM-dependent methyltransferase [Cohnella thermotolerans]
MIVTTTERPEPGTIERARRLAAELKCACVPRGRNTLRKLGRLRPDAADGILVVGPDTLRFVRGEEPPLFYHPSMGLIRVKRLREGGDDGLVRAADARPGDTVLDCTAGLGSDSLVLSYAVGESGRVTALEASDVLHVIVREGMRVYRSELPDVDEAMRRIEHVKTDHLRYLRSLPDRSCDIVYFDPMFTKPVMASASLRPLRAVAEDAPLSEESVAEARRVARKRIVLKEHRDSGEFERLGFERGRMTDSSVAYGVIDV